METLIKNFVKIFRRDIRLLRNGSMLIAAALLALALAVGANSAAFKLHNLISIRSLTIEDHNRAMDWRIDIRHQSGLEERRNSFVREIQFPGRSRIAIGNR